MRALPKPIHVGIVILISSSTLHATEARAGSNCPDSTDILEPLYSWGIPSNGWGIVMGANGKVYVTDPVNDRICRYSIYGSEEMCWDSPDPGDPGQFVQPRWLAWNPKNSRLYVSGQLGGPVVPVYDADGNFLFDIEADSLSTEPGQFAGETWSIDIDPVTGFLWVHEQNELDNVTVDRIQEFDLAGEFTGRVFNRGPGCEFPGFSQVEDIAVDSTGSVYMLDWGGTVSAVRRVVPGVGCVASWGDQPGPGRLTRGRQIAIDKDGHINVLDTSPSGAFVRKYNRSGDHIASMQIGVAADVSFGLEFMRESADPFMFVGQTPFRIVAYGTGIEPRNVLATSWVDPQSFQLQTDDLQELAECPTNQRDPRKKMVGVVADGVSPLLLRLHLPEPGTVRWELADPDNPGILEELGTLSNLDSTDTGSVIETEVESVDGEHIAFAVYTAPIDFERPSVPADAAVGSRPLEVTAVFQPNETDSVIIVRNLVIERPRVVFLHGFLEGSGDWDRFKSIVSGVDTTRWGEKRILKVDYTGTHGEPLAVNAGMLASELQSVTASARDSLIAAAQVDIVSHSMGGLVLRRLADASPPTDPFRFRSAFNMGQGFYHKALFLNVPHQGSPLGDIAVSLRNTMNNFFAGPLRRQTARRFLEAYAEMEEVRFEQVIAGAIDDLSLGSDAVVNLEPFLAPTHAHVGTGGSDLWFTPRLLEAAGTRVVVSFVGLITTLSNLSEIDLLATEVHDIAVLLDSQIGGLSNSGHYIAANFEDGLHESSFSSSIAGSRARDWATHSVGDASFFASSLPGGSSLAPSPEIRERLRALEQAIGEGIPEFAGVTVRIVTPTAGVEAAGDSFLVEVEALSDVSRVIVTYPGGALFMDSTLAGYAHTDSSMNGAFELSALALMADGTLGRSEPVTITVRPPLSVTLDGIEVTPPSVSLPGIGSVLNLRVVGNYSDGVQRDIASSASGTTYSGFDSDVVAVTPDGVLRGSGMGVTMVTVQKGAYSKAVTVDVGDAPPINNRPHAVAGGPYQICNGDGVTLDATQSFDFDGGQLTYSWDLNGDGQFGDLVGASVFYSPPYIVDDRLVGLRVTDSSGAMSEDYTAIQVPLSCFTGQRICATALIATEASDLGVDDAGDVYIFRRLDETGSIMKRSGTCVFDVSSLTIFDPEDLHELAVDSTGVAYVAGAPADERILLFGPGSFSELEPLIPVSTTPYSLVTGIAVDGRGNLYGSDYEAGAQHVFIRKFDQAQPTANLLASWNLTTTAGIMSAEPLSVAIGADSAIFVGIGNEVLKGVAQGGGYVLERRWGSSGLGAGQFRGVSDVAVGPDGDVFVSDYGNHRVQRFDSDGTFRSMRKGTHVSSGKFYHPTAVIAVDSMRVAVADFEFGGDPRVQVFFWGDALPTTVPPRPVVFDDALAQNFPNPFNPTTTVSFSLSQAGHVTVAVYDVRGALVRTLVNERRTAGDYRVVWDGVNDDGIGVSSGVYFYRLSAAGFQSTKKMVLLK